MERLRRAAAGVALGIGSLGIGSSVEVIAQEPVEANSEQTADSPDQQNVPFDPTWKQLYILMGTILPVVVGGYVYSGKKMKRTISENAAAQSDPREGAPSQREDVDINR